MSFEVEVPELGESVVEAYIGRWIKNIGDPVKAGDPLVELETDKVNIEAPSEVDGVLISQLRAEGDVVKVGEVIAVVEEIAAGETAVIPAPSVPEPAATPIVTPIAKKIAEEKGLDVAAIKGSGARGKVTREDVSLTPAPSAPVSASLAPAPQPFSSVDLGRPQERIRLSRRRITIAQRLVEAQHTAAMLTTFNEVDMTAVMDLRQRRKDEFEKRAGVKLGFMSFFVKAVVAALKVYPNVNSQLEGDDLIVKKFYDIGIAVSTPAGLVAPVVRDADRMNFAEIEREIANLAKKARENTLSLAQLQGGTFTVTNGGVFGSLMSTPILNTPQVGILGMHKIQERAVVIDHQIVIRPMMYLAHSYDHRVIDGREAVGFLVKVKELLEDPESLLLEG
jgi:2-oxoglutarate dehydrogenase E2 component (dihydrolipoamide succinyltransferase)